ncbi:MAG: sensor histidine kinase [Bacteroidales bacterium]
MIDLAMHTMDIIQNSIRAGADILTLKFAENTKTHELIFMLEDNGSGMDEQMLENSQNPFYTSRTTRKVGLGIPMLKMTAEQSCGWFRLQSEPGKGTIVKAMYRTDNIDCLPLGDMPAYLSLVLAANPDISIDFTYSLNEHVFSFTTDELKEAGITDYASPAMRETIKEFIKENLEDLFQHRNKSSYLC